jgi:hypothetical protein
MFIVTPYKIILLLLSSSSALNCDCRTLFGAPDFESNCPLVIHTERKQMSMYEHI